MAGELTVEDVTQIRDGLLEKAGKEGADLKDVNHLRDILRVSTDERIQRVLYRGISTLLGLLKPCPAS